MEPIISNNDLITFGVNNNLSTLTNTTEASNANPNNQTFSPIRLIENPVKQIENRPPIMLKYFFSRNEEPVIESKDNKIKHEDLVPDFDFEKGLKLEIEAPYKSYKAKPILSEKIPIKISFQAADMNLDNQKLLEQRCGIDLICVVDISGSMAGEKLDLVKQTLKYIISLLKENDRLSLITFHSSAEQLFSLRCVSENNMTMFNEVIESLVDKGSTNINSGIHLAMDIIKTRKYKNPITSVFLLSDGRDTTNSSFYVSKKIQKTIQEVKTLDSFTIHSFGFGAKHDADLMREIARFRGGNFYYISELKTIDECFVDAIGLLFSVILKDVVIKVKVNNEGFLNDMRICKTFGDMWRSSEEKEKIIHTIELQMFSIGMKKDYICQLNLPPIKKQLDANEKQLIFVEAEMTGNGIKEGKPVSKVAKLTLNLLSGKEEIEEEINTDVVINYLRVKGAEKIEIAKNLSDQEQFVKARGVLEKMQKKLENCACKDHPSLILLKENINKSIDICQPQRYDNGTKSHMSGYSHTNMFQQSAPYTKVGKSNNYYGTRLQEHLSNNLGLTKSNQN